MKNLYDEEPSDYEDSYEDKDYDVSEDDGGSDDDFRHNVSSMERSYVTRRHAKILQEGKRKLQYIQRSIRSEKQTLRATKRLLRFSRVFILIWFDKCWFLKILSEGRKIKHRHKYRRK